MWSTDRREDGENQWNMSENLIYENIHSHTHTRRCYRRARFVINESIKGNYSPKTLHQQWLRIPKREDKKSGGDGMFDITMIV